MTVIIQSCVESNHDESMSAGQGTGWRSGCEEGHDCDSRACILRDAARNAAPPATTAKPLRGDEVLGPMFAVRFNPRRGTYSSPMVRRRASAVSGRCVASLGE